MMRKTNKGKKFPTSRVNALQSGAYACDVYSTRFYLAKLTAAVAHLGEMTSSKSVTVPEGQLATSCKKV